MENINAESIQIKVEIIVRDGCNFSNDTLKSLIQSQAQYPEMSLSVVDIADTSDNRRTIGGITPSIWVNNKLWFLGSFSAKTFHSKLTAITSSRPSS